MREKKLQLFVLGEEGKGRMFAHRTPSILSESYCRRHVRMYAQLNAVMCAYRLGLYTILLTKSAMPCVIFSNFSSALKQPLSLPLKHVPTYSRLTEYLQCSPRSFPLNYQCSVFFFIKKKDNAKAKFFFSSAPFYFIISPIGLVFLMARTIALSFQHKKKK